MFGSHETMVLLVLWLSNPLPPISNPTLRSSSKLVLRSSEEIVGLFFIKLFNAELRHNYYLCLAPISLGSDGSMESISEQQGLKKRTEESASVEASRESPAAPPVQNVGPMEVNGVIEEIPKASLPNGGTVNGSEVAVEDSNQGDGDTNQGGGDTNQGGENMNQGGGDSNQGGSEVTDDHFEVINGEVENGEIENGEIDVSSNGDVIGTKAIVKENNASEKINHSETVLKNDLQGTEKSEIENGEALNIDDVDVVMENGINDEGLSMTHNPGLVCDSERNEIENQLAENKETGEQKGSGETAKEQNHSNEVEGAAPPSLSNGFEAAVPLNNGKLSNEEKLNENIMQKSNDQGNAEEKSDLTADEEKHVKTTERVKERIETKMKEKDGGKIENVFDKENEQNELGNESFQDDRNHKTDEKKSRKTKRHGATCACYPRRHKEKQTDNCSII